VLGDPVAHSLSPALHRAAYADLGLDWEYDAHRVPAGGLESFLTALGPEWRGLSLTMPLKREALAAADEVTDRARLAGAVNTLVLDDGSRVGDNTDLPGAVAAIRERTTVPLASAVVLGGGATATSIGLALVELGVTSIELLVRDASRAQETVDALRSHPGGVDVRTAELGLGDPVAADIVVSTIPASAQADDLVARTADVPVVFEALYDPWPTPLAAAAQASGRTLVGGLDLLVHQAALQLELFTGLAAPLDTMRESGERALAARNPA